MATDRTEELIQALVDAVATGDDARAERAAQACAGRPALLPALRPLLADADPDRRWWAVRTLGLLGGAETVQLLIERLGDDDTATQCAAALALGERAAAEAIPALLLRLADKNGWVRDSAGDALALIGEPALSALTAALADPRDGVRVRAAAALRKVVTPRLAGRAVPDFPAQFWPAVNALFTALNDPNRLVRHNAYEALDRLGLLQTILVNP